ncbi:MAG TPA: peptide-N-glycosidase F-related protein [Phycisphaerales bacterium]|nr:peptide-N-glycosidase F-related protein [Phycisphaerales bacterium]HRQ76352.1 peptide-N-glycosidase F-related protein [Phycisphaerales bacterium]
MSHASSEDSEPTAIVVFDAVALELDRDLPEPAIRDGYMLRSAGRVAERTLTLPGPAAELRGTPRITATVAVQPRLVHPAPGLSLGGAQETRVARPGDPWTRMGNVTVLLPSEGDEPIEIELMRFITGFGGAGTFTQDLTALSPLLQGKVTLRVMMTTYMNPGWDVSLTLTYSDEAGYRRPAFVAPLFNEQHVCAKNNVLRARVVIPEGLEQPRIRLMSTGHATDGAGGDEFITRTHILRIDGEEVLRWRPWAENGASLRSLNPMSGRFNIDGRIVWSSDLDRSGWHPGLVVTPMQVPLPELSPGAHHIELEVVGIRPADPEDELGDHGYWRISGVVVADEVWPVAE